MKKIILAAIAAVSVFTAGAEDFAVGGSVSLWRNDTQKTTDFSIVPEISYDLDSKWTIGTAIGFSHSETNTAGGKYKGNFFVFQPYARYTFFRYQKVSLFADGRFGINAGSAKIGGHKTDTAVAWNLGITPGVSFDINSKFSVEAHLGFLGYKGANDEAEPAYNRGFGFTFSSNDLSLGVLYHF